MKSIGGEEDGEGGWREGCSMEKGEETNVYAVFKCVNGKQRREISVLLFCTTHLVTVQSQFQDRRKSKLVAVGWVRSVKFCCAIK